MFRKTALGAAAIALAALPIGAAAVDRAAAPVEGEARLNGNGALFLLAAVAIVAAAVVFLPDEPASP